MDGVNGLLGAIGALVAALAGAYALVVRTYKSVETGNSAKQAKAIVELQRNSERTDKVVKHLTDKAFVSRELIRLLIEERTVEGHALTPEMKRLYKELDRVMDYTDMFDPEEIEEAAEESARHRREEEGET